jgi:hypothetical protein
MILVPTPSSSANEFIGAGEAACYGGLFCLKSISETNRQIHLFRYDQGKIEHLFAKSVSRAVHFPICLTNGVVAVSSDGVVRKFDLNGDLVFSAKPAGFEGLARDSGRIDFDHIFITEVTTNAQNNSSLYQLLVVDVTGSLPIVKSKSGIIQPFRVVVTGEDLVILGLTNTQRLKVRQDMARPKK